MLCYVLKRCATVLAPYNLTFVNNDASATVWTLSRITVLGLAWGRWSGKYLRQYKNALGVVNKTILKEAFFHHPFQILCDALAGFLHYCANAIQRGDILKAYNVEVFVKQALLSFPDICRN